MYNVGSGISNKRNNAIYFVSNDRRMRGNQSILGQITNCRAAVELLWSADLLMRSDIN